MSTIAAGHRPEPSFIDEVAERVLEDWSGLRLYLRQRRAGRPADRTMDTLLSELLRMHLRGADIGDLIAHLTGAGRQEPPPQR